MIPRGLYCYIESYHTFGGVGGEKLNCYIGGGIEIEKNSKHKLGRHNTLCAMIEFNSVC